MLAWLFLGVDIKLLLINGIVTGAVFAIAASGLVVTYSTSGIFNFAHGAMGMLCSYVYWDLRFNNHHKYWFIARDSALQHAWPAPLALGFVLFVFAPLMGALIYRVIIRGLQGTSETIKIVIPISLLLFGIGLAGVTWKNNQPHALKPFFGLSKTVNVGGVTLTYHDVTIVIVSVVLAFALRFLLYKTRTGVSMRGVVDDRSLLELNGGRPDVASQVSWMVGVSLSGLAGILIAPFQGGSLSSTLLTLLVINAYAAAMWGRLRSLPLTYLGAVVIGIATRAAFEKPTGIMPRTWDWRGNLRVAVPMIMLFIVLLVLPQDRLRGAVVSRTRERFTLPGMGQSVISGGVLILVVLMLSRIMADAAAITLANGIGAAIIVLSLVPLVGYAGETSFATMAFAGIGGLTMYHHVQHTANARAGITPYVMAVLVAAVVGGVVALPALRLRGLYLALATAAFSVAVENMVMKEITVSRRIYPVTLILIVTIGLASAFYAWRAYKARGASIALAIVAAVLALAMTNSWLKHEKWSPLFNAGNLTIPRPRMFGVDFKPQRNYLLLLTTVFALIGMGLVALRRSAYGRRLSAMKDSPAACATLGMSVVRLKLSVFMLSAAIAGLGGCLYGGQIGAISAERFGLFESMAMFMLVVIAGVGYVSGGFVGGLLHSAVFITFQGILTKLGHDYSAFHGMFKWIATMIVPIGPALAGIGLGKNPTGFVNDFFIGYKPVIRKTMPIFLAGCAAEVVMWWLALEKHIGNWTFAIFTILTVILLPRIAMLLKPSAFVPQDVLDARAAETPAELIGIDRSFTVADKRRFDTILQLPSRRTEGARS